MTLRYYLDGSELATARVRLGEGGPLTSAADSGVLGSGRVIIDDPDGNLTFNGWKTFHVVEDACSQPRLWTGWIAERRIGRGRSSHRTGASRTHDCVLVDLNAIFSLRRIRGDSGKRPYENDTGARIPWILGTEFFNNLLYSGTITAQVINFDETDYRGSPPLSVFADIAPVAGCTFFAYWDQTQTPGTQIRLFYAKPADAVRSATLRVSNVLADVDSSTTFGVVGDGELTVAERSPSEVYSGVDLTYKGGTIYLQRAQTITDFISRDGALTSDRIGRLATAQAVGAAWLEQFSAEFDTLTWQMELPADKVGLITAGQRMEVKFSHLPGYESFTWVRLTRVDLFPIHENRYRLVCQAGLRTPPPSSSGSPGNFPWQAGDTPTLVQDKTGSVAGAGFALDVTPTAGNLLLAFVADRDGGGDITVTTAGWTKIARATNTTSFVRDGHAYYRIADGTNPVFSADGPVDALWTTLMEWDGSYSGVFAMADTVASTTDLNCGGPVAPTASAAVVVGLGVIGFSDADYPGTSVAPDANVVEVTDIGSGSGGGFSPGLWVGYLPVASVSGSYTVGGTISGAKTYCGITIVIDGSGGTAPSPGQPVPPQVPTGTVDGSNTDFTAPHPFADGSARIYIDGDYQPGEPASYDGATGAVTLSFAPRGAVGDEPAEAVTIEYQGR